MNLLPPLPAKYRWALNLDGEVLVILIYKNVASLKRRDQVEIDPSWDKARFHSEVGKVTRQMSSEISRSEEIRGWVSELKGYG